MLVEQSKLSGRDFALLALFDAFEHDAEPFSFRDLILAKKYAGLIASGANWISIAKSVRQSGSVASLTALSLHADRGDAIYARLPEGISELNGQVLLPLDRVAEEDLDELFAEAEEAEEEGRHTQAADLYRRCIAVDPADATSFFNRGNCLAAAGHMDDAKLSYLEALKRDPQFVEAWFNLADLASKQGDPGAARRCLERAIALDGDYADAVFNLASLEYEAGNLAEARKWWSRYVELDGASEWARRAKRGIQLVDLEQARKSAGAA
jgi:tetratricopeptide (TPR) repeat protein